MRISVKCSSAVHILLMIAVVPADKKITSDYLSSSVGNNPVETRKLLSRLKKADIIDVQRGPGGAILKKSPDKISLYDIYSAVDSASLDELIGIHNNPEERCPFGRNITRLLSERYEEISNVIQQKMESITLKDFVTRLYELEPDIDESFDIV